jgi:hypothetical protein
MKLGLINSAWAQAGRETAWGIAQTKTIGFDTIDIFADPLQIDVRERRLIRDECRRHQLPIVSVCCVAVGLIDFNPSVQRFHLQRCQAYLDLVYELEGRNLLLVLASTSGTARSFRRRNSGAPAWSSAGGWPNLRRNWGCRSPWSWSRSRCRC